MVSNGFGQLHSVVCSFCIDFGRMIHPLPDEKVKVVLSRQSFPTLVLYYVLGFLLALVNFVPLAMKDSANAASLERPSPHVYNLLSYCAGLSLPLFFELILDLIFSVFLPALYERRFGHGVLLLSLLFAGIPVVRHSSILFIMCFISFCQCIAACAIYGKLQVYGSRWKIYMCLPIMALFVVAQISICTGFARCRVDPRGYCRIGPEYLFASFIMYGACFFLQLKFAHKYGIDFWRSYRRGQKVFANFAADDYVCLILQLIMALYYFLSFIFLIAAFNKAKSFDYFLSGLVLRHIVLNMTASILPGRMVRRDLSVLKVSECLV